ncbi:ATP-dependent Clp protease adapter ClpS [Galactobacter sp.]|uniref:ATP-dependent Clp protease adapter ClpS n=1 Tax=Galactobacter sp. TaxID=2676125 RepID=UPI0025BC3D00|nr:ATP-dependent Clp protease adapter ClpS [Galactobacter sp.]
MTTVNMAPVAAPVESPVEDTALETRLDRPYELLVWDDPVNLMSYVAYIFRSYFGYSAPRAEELMLQVHHEGKAVVASGSRERIEADLVAMHGYGLQATLRQES